MDIHKEMHETEMRETHSGFLHRETNKITVALVVASFLGAAGFVGLILFALLPNTFAFVGPTVPVGTGSGAIAVDAQYKVGLGTATPSYKLDVQSGQINSSGGLCIAGDCKTLWSQVSGVGPWSRSGTNVYLTTSTDSVGIGTSTPLSRFAISNGADEMMRFTRSGATYPTIFRVGTDGAFVLKNNNVDAITVKAGNVGIGAASPADPLHVISNSSGEALRLEENSGGEEWRLGISSAGDLNFIDSGTTRLTLLDGASLGNCSFLTTDSSGNLSCSTSKVAIDGNGSYLRVAVFVGNSVLKGGPITFENPVWTNGDFTGNVVISGDVRPTPNNSKKLGSQSYAWSAIYAYDGTFYDDLVVNDRIDALTANFDNTLTVGNITNGGATIYGPLNVPFIPTNPSAHTIGTLYINNVGIAPTSDNTRMNGTASNRWSDVRAVKINGADISLHNGWTFREWPAEDKDIGKPVEWFKENANQGIQIFDDEGDLKAVIHKDGNLYIKGKVKSLSELPEWQ